MLKYLLSVLAWEIYTRNLTYIQAWSHFPSNLNLIPQLNESLDERGRIVFCMWQNANGHGKRMNCDRMHFLNMITVIGMAAHELPECLAGNYIFTPLTLGGILRLSWWRQHDTRGYWVIPRPIEEEMMLLPACLFHVTWVCKWTVMSWASRVHTDAKFRDFVSDSDQTSQPSQQSWSTASRSAGRLIYSLAFKNLIWVLQISDFWPK